MSEGFLKSALFNQNLVHFHPKKSKKSQMMLHETDSTILPKISHPIYYNSQASSGSRNLNRHNRSLSTYDVTDFSPKVLRKKGSLYKYLSSKVDFFNEQNQRRLNLQKKKVLTDKGIISVRKQNVSTPRSKSSVSPAMVLLLQRYLSKRSESECRSEKFYIVGHDA